MFMICHDLKNQISRPSKIAIDVDVSVADNGQTLTNCHPLHFYNTSHLYQNKGNSNLISFIFDRDFPVFLPKNG